LRSIGKSFLRILIPTAFFVYVFHVIRIDDVVSAFHKTEWPWFMTGCLCVFIPVLLSSVRTRGLLTGVPPSLGQLWAIHAVSSLVAGVLPFRAGELSYVYYLHRHGRVPISTGAAIWISFRFVEYLLALILLLCLSGLVVIRRPTDFSWTALIIIGSNLLIFLFLVWKADFFYRVFQAAVRLLVSRSPMGRAGDMVLRKLDNFFGHVKGAFSRNLSVKLLLLSLAIVTSRYLFVLAMVRGMAVSVSVGLALFLFVFLYAVKFVQGFGSFGSQEAGITAALMVSGMSQSDALPVAIGTHLLQWIPILFFGLVGRMMLRSRGTESKRD
jgi:glycosyltransferase 2 family protein